MDEIKNTLKTMSRAMGIKKYREDEPEPVLNCSEPQQVTKNPVPADVVNMLKIMMDEDDIKNKDNQELAKNVLDWFDKYEKTQGGDGNNTESVYLSKTIKIWSSCNFQKICSFLVWSSMRVY